MRRTRTFRPEALDHPLESRELLSAAGARLAEVEQIRAERADVHAEAVAARAAKRALHLTPGQVGSNPLSVFNGSTTSVGGFNGTGLNSGVGLTTGGTTTTTGTAGTSAAATAAANAALQEEILIGDLALLNSLPGSAATVSPVATSTFGLTPGLSPTGTALSSGTATTLLGGGLGNLSFNNGLSLIGNSSTSSTFASTAASAETTAANLATSVVTNAYTNASFGTLSGVNALYGLAPSTNGLGFALTGPAGFENLGQGSGQSTSANTTNGTSTANTTGTTSTTPNGSMNLTMPSLPGTSVAQTSNQGFGVNGFYL